MTVLALKLITTEDIVGDITFDDATNEYVVKEPAQLLIIPNNSKQPSFGFVPYPIHAERGSNFSLRFHKDHVIIKPVEIGRAHV